MADKTIALLAETKGVPVYDDAAVIEERGYTFSCAVQYSTNVYGITVVLDEESWSKEKFRELKQALKRLGRLAYAQGVLTIHVGGMSAKARARRYEEAVSAIGAELERLEIAPGDRCHYCGERGCDDSVVELRICRPAHGRCKREKADEIVAKIEDNMQNGNMIIGIVGALLGGAVGCLPNLIILAITKGTYYPVLYFLIPLASYTGYQLTRGVMNRAVPFIVSVISILCTILLEFAFTYVLVYQQLLEYDYAYSVAEFLTDLNDVEVMVEILQEAALSLVFCIIGIVVAWRHISRTNKHKLQEAEQLRQSIAK